MNDVTKPLADCNHQYDPDVIEFFNTIKYLGGEKTVNFVRGAVWNGCCPERPGSRMDPLKANPNLGGPLTLLWKSVCLATQRRVV